jgi:hypothetical protein
MDKDRARLLRDNAFSETSRYEPERVTVTRKRHGEKAARAMQTAIALDKARQLGVRIPK